MAAAVELRDDFNATAVRGLARRSKDPGQIRRLLAPAGIYEGHSRGETARVGGVGLQTLRLGSALQCHRPCRTDRRQGARSAFEAQRRVASATPAHCGDRPDTRDPRCGPLAPDRSGPVAVRGIWPLDRPADPQPGDAGASSAQDLRPPSAPCPGSEAPALTPKRQAASRQEASPDTKATTRSDRSTDNDDGIGSLLPNPITPHVNPRSNFLGNGSR